MELGSWSIIQAPSLLALIPLVVMIVLIFRGKSNVSAIMVGVLVGALLLGQDLGAMAKAFATSLGSSTALIGLIIMMGAGLGVLMIQAAIPFAVFWLAGAWVGANRAQKRTFGKEGYALGEDVQHLDQVVITPRQKRTTVAFLISFVLLVGYGIATKQGTNYALMVMIVLAAVVAIFGGIEIDRSVDCITKGVASQANMFLIFVSIDVLLNLVTLGGGFDALSNLLGGLAGNSPTAVMLVASVVGGFGIEAAAVAEIQIITDMFGGLATQVGLPMGCFAVSILAATRLTGSAYPTTNFAGQLGTAQCSNTKEALQACWISVAFACVFVVAYSFIGPLILG